MAVYDVFQALGLRLDVQAILDTDGMESEEEYYSDSDSNSGQQKEERLKDKDIVGRTGGLKFTEVGGNEESNREIVREWGGQDLDITWVNEGAQSSIDMVHLTVCAGSMIAQSKGTDTRSMGIRQASVLFTQGLPSLLRCLLLRSGVLMGRGASRSRLTEKLCALDSAGFLFPLLMVCLALDVKSSRCRWAWHASSATAATPCVLSLGMPIAHRGSFGGL